MKEVRSGFIRTVYIGPPLFHPHAAGDFLNVDHPGGPSPASTDDSSLIKKETSLIGFI